MIVNGLNRDGYTVETTQSYIVDNHVYDLIDLFANVKVYFYCFRNI